MASKEPGNTTCLLLILIVLAVIVFAGVLSTADPETLNAAATAAAQW